MDLFEELDVAGDWDAFEESGDSKFAELELACVDEGKTTKATHEFSEGDLMLEEFKSDPLDWSEVLLGDGDFCVVRILGGVLQIEFESSPVDVRLCLLFVAVQCLLGDSKYAYTL